jgi:hypothetical protein
MRERERESGGVMEDNAFNGETEINKFTAMKVPRQCQIFLLVKVG